MSYAQETRKRKFDRIIESLNESPSQRSKQNSTTNTGTNAVTRTRPTTVKEVLEAAKRRRVTPTLSKSASNGSLAGHYLPSSRVAFLERLETYRHITKWHIPSTIPVNAAEWAKRGWVCSDIDTVACGSCSERVVVDLSVASRPLSSDKENTNLEEVHEKEIDRTQREEDEEDMAAEVYEALVRRYQSMIITAHTEDCPWRKRGCESSIQKIERLLNTSSVIETTRARAEGIASKIEDVPTVADLPAIEDMFIPENNGLRFSDVLSLDVNAIKLAICGWQFREGDVIECKHCFRSLGLWLYRGEAPTIEHLDPVESHLEYCPWRSALAQNNEFPIQSQTSKETTKKLPGWALVYIAMQQHNHRQRGGKNFSFSSLSNPDGDHIDRDEPTPEQREKKVRDLIQRIKDIKKPFNVKSLLRKKDKPDR